MVGRGCTTEGGVTDGWRGAMGGRGRRRRDRWMEEEARWREGATGGGGRRRRDGRIEGGAMGGKGRRRRDRRMEEEARWREGRNWRWREEEA
jgi:hypothetical protein